MKKSPLIYDKTMHEARKYWRDRLDTTSFAGHIALDHPRKDVQQQLTSLERPLDPEAHALLRRLSGGNPFLAYTALVSALKVCCHKYSGEREVMVFSPATSDSAVTALLPISSTLDGSASFKDVLLATKELLSNAFKYQQYPFSRMLIDLPDERRPGHLPMIAAMVGFNEEIPEVRCDITIRFEVTEDRTNVTFGFDGRVHDESTVLRFFDFFSGVLRQGLGDPATRILDLGLEQAAEEVDAQDLFLHRLIETQAAQQPQSVAVVERDRATTYGTLDHDAERLAKTLAGLTLDVRKPVVILMDAGTEMIASMLAVLKTGAAFAPIKLLATSGGPISNVLDALGCQCIICQPEHLADLQQLRVDLTGIQHVVTVEYAAQTDGDGAPSFQIACQGGSASQTGPGQEPIPAPPPNGGDEGRFSTACVIVGGREDRRASSRVTHAELVSIFQTLKGRCGIGPDDRCLLSPGLGVSEHLYDTLGMLSAGGSVEITDAAGLKNASLLLERLLAPSITVWDLPTPLAQNLLGSLLALRAERPHLQGPRNFLSSEKQCVHLADKLAQCFPDARITGVYASPAVGIWTTLFPLREDSAEGRRAVTAQAITGFEHQVLNRSGEPAPFHTKGELHLRRLFSTPEPALKTGLRAEARDRGRVVWLRGADHCFGKYGCLVELTRLEAVLCQQEHIRPRKSSRRKPFTNLLPYMLQNLFFHHGRRAHVGQ